MYLDISKEFDETTAKVDEILKYNCSCIFIAMDSNSRSTGWYDNKTNARGKTLEEYLISRNLHIMNEESERTTFQSRRGRSNIDLTIVINRLLKKLNDWEISENESCSDHNIIIFKIGYGTNYETQHNYNGIRHITNEQAYDRFDKNLKELIAMKFRMNNSEELPRLDCHLATYIRETCDIESAVEKLQEAITLSCNKSFKFLDSTKKMIKHKAVPWWTDELTINRKRLNALRRRYQRTKNNKELREHRKNIYYEEKTRYQTKIRKEKLNSWKEYCNLKTCTNPWNSVYKLARNKTKRSLPMTTLQRPDGSFTSDLNETVKFMIEYLIPKDEQIDDTDYHKRIRAQTEEPILTADDRDSTPSEVKNAIVDLKLKKAPGEDGVTAEIYQRVFKLFPIFIYTIYNECLRKGCFPKKWKKVKIIPITNQEKKTQRKFQNLGQ